MFFILKLDWEVTDVVIRDQFFSYVFTRKDNGSCIIIYFNFGGIYDLGVEFDKWAKVSYIVSRFDHYS